ncbi:PPE family protein [Mycobacterium kansasii]|uniref:PPE family protein n=1 Tax=Mycobacterium kansasii TaxID=1768 RepID=A0A1V3WAT7_MYCKA|nr:PPE family protein [Mycobacterium kansasii]
MKETRVMNFTVLPPEINSARMYAGAGRRRCWRPRPPGTAGADLQASAVSFESVASCLVTSWQGAASTAMTAAPHRIWLAERGRTAR